jgi:hypothetical protein
VPSLRVEKKAKTELRHAQYQLGKWALCHTRTASASGAAFVRPRFPNYTTATGCMDCAGRDSAFAMRRCFSYIWLMDPACISSLLLLLLLTIPSRLAKRSGCFASPYPRTAASRIAVGTSRTARLVVQRMSSFETRRLVKYGSSPQHVGKVRRQQRPDQKIGRRGPDKIRGGALVARTRGSYRGSA